VVADGAGERPAILGRDERPTPSSGADDVVSALNASARAALAAAEVSTHDIVAAGCAAPGPLDHLSGVIHEAPNIAGFVDFPLADRLRDALELTVFVDRDTSMAAIAESLTGAARGVPDFVYVTVSTGLGGAIVSGGRMIRGATNTAGEIGHLPVGLPDEGAPRCGCGSVGCAEAYVAGRHLAERFGASGADDVYAAARRGDARAVALVERSELALGNLAVGLVNVLNPSLIVVGGSIAEHEPDHVLAPMRRHIAERAFRVPAAAVRVVPAALAADVGTIGAALCARERAAGRGQWFL